MAKLMRTNVRKAYETGRAEADVSRLKSLWTAAWPFGLLGLLTAVWFFPLLSSPSNTRLDTPDVNNYFLWIHGYAREQMLAGQVPLWNPYNYAGLPFAANPQCTVFYPPSWLYLMMPVLQAHKWMIATHVLLAGSLMYLLLRRLGLGKGPALVGTLPYMLGGYTIANSAVAHLPMLFTMSWLPLIVYCYERALAGEGRRWLVGAGLVLGVQLLAGEPQNTYYTILLICGYGLLRSLFARTAETRVPRLLARWAGGIALIGVVSALASAVQLFLTLEMVRYSDRSSNSYEFATSLSLPLSSLLMFLMPWTDGVRGLQFGEEVTSFFIFTTWEFSGYVGLITLTLVAVGLFVRGRPQLNAAKVLLLVAIVLMLGRHTPVYAVLLKVLPGLKSFRIPARAVVIAVWAMCLLTGFGAAYLAEVRASGRKPLRWQLGAFTFVLLATAAAVISVLALPVSKFLAVGINRQTTIAPLPISDPIVLRFVAAAVVTLLAVTVIRWMPARRVIWVLGLCIVLDLFIGRPPFTVKEFVPELDRNLQMVGKLKAAAEGGGPFRIDVPASALPANACMAAKVCNVNGYWPLALARLFRFAHEMHGRKPPPRDRHQLPDVLYRREEPFATRFLNVRYAGVLDEAGTRMTMNEKKGFPPRAWLVGAAETVSSPDAALARVRDLAWFPADSVVLEAPPRIQLPGKLESPGTCEVQTHPYGGLTIRTRSTQPAYLVIADVYYPGWYATVDGQEVALEPANYVIEALPLPAGEHRVVLTYRPWTFPAGLACTTLTWLAAAGFAVSRLRPAARVTQGDARAR